MKQIIAMHGWAGDSDSWKTWADHFQSEGWLWQNGERGYGDLSTLKPHWIKEKPKALNTKRTVIGHSLGPHLLSSEILEEATDIVLLGSFSRFLRQGKRDRLMEASLKAMQKHIGTKLEQQMLSSFLEKAIYPDKPKKLPVGPITKGLSPDGRKKLQEDLNLLINTNGLPTGLPRKARVLVIEGKEDSIIDPSTRLRLLKDLQKHLYCPPTHWQFSNTGHSLLIPGLIKRVQNWLESSK